MNREEEIRESVTEAYKKALRAKEEGCCGAAPQPSPTCCTGYEEEAQRFAEAAASSFGCGNPLAMAKVEPGQTVLDLGSGAGLDLLIAAEKVGPQGRVIGVDMTDEMLAAARAAVERAGAHQVELRKGIIEDLPVESDSVDWVISNCVINLSPEKPRVFAEIFRVLRRGGRFSISDMVVEELPAWLRQSAEAYAACLSGAIPEREYVAGLEEAGLAAVEVADRVVYDAEQLRAMAGDQFEALGMDEQTLECGLAQVVGKVWSARFVGRKP